MSPTRPGRLDTLSAALASNAMLEDRASQKNAAFGAGVTAERTGFQRHDLTRMCAYNAKFRQQQMQSGQLPNANDPSH